MPGTPVRFLHSHTTPRHGRDGDNWRLGHWLNGRIANGTLAETVSTILTDSGFDAFDASGLTGMVPGFVIDRILSVREALQPLELAYFFDAIELRGTIRFRHRGSGGVVATLEPDVLAETRRGRAAAAIARRQETDLPQSAKITYIQANADYAQAVAEARRRLARAGVSRRHSCRCVLEPAQAGLTGGCMAIREMGDSEQANLRSRRRSGIRAWRHGGAAERETGNDVPHYRNQRAWRLAKSRSQSSICLHTILRSANAAHGLRAASWLASRSSSCLTFRSLRGDEPETAGWGGVALAVAGECRLLPIARNLQDSSLARGDPSSAMLGPRSQPLAAWSDDQ